MFSLIGFIGDRTKSFLKSVSCSTIKLENNPAIYTLPCARRFQDNKIFQFFYIHGQNSLWSLPSKANKASD